MVGCAGRDEGAKGDVCCVNGVTSGDDGGISGVDVSAGDVGASRDVEDSGRVSEE